MLDRGVARMSRLTSRFLRVDIGGFRHCCGLDNGKGMG